MGLKGRMCGGEGNSMEKERKKIWKGGKYMKFLTSIRLFEVKMHLYPSPYPLHLPLFLRYRVFPPCFIYLIFLSFITHCYHLASITPPRDLVSIIPSSLVLSITLSSHFVSLHLSFCIYNPSALLDSIIPFSLIVSFLLPLPPLFSSLSPNF